MSSTVTSARCGRAVAVGCLIAAVFVPSFGVTTVSAAHPGERQAVTASPASETVPTSLPSEQTESEPAPTASAPTTTTVPPSRRAARPVHAVVDLSEQHAYFYAADGALLKRVPVSTGAPGTRTRIGRFKVYSRSAATFSRSNPAVKMRHMTRFDGGIGFHGIPYRVRGGVEVPLPTPLGKRPVSHGCVRMRDRDARWVFRFLPTGAPVVVQN